MNDEGWVSVSDLLKGIEQFSTFGRKILEDIQEVMAQSDKKRFEIDGNNNQIRAFYGHSLEKKIKREKKEPPAVLYHGTSPRSLDDIFKSGLKPMGRQNVHLSTTKETATKVGRRHHRNPIILRVDAKSAWDEGHAFYIGNEDIWLSDEIPARYLQVTDKINESSPRSSGDRASVS